MRPGCSFDQEFIKDDNEREVELSEVITSDHDIENENDLKLAEEKIHFTFWKSPILWILVIVGILCGVEVLNITTDFFADGFFFGSVFSVFLVSILVIILLLIVREISSVLLLVDGEKNRNKISHIAELGSYKEALNQCTSMMNNKYPQELKKRFLESVQPHFSAKEVFELYERIVLSDADKRAKKVIFTRSIETSLVVAMSPLAWIDMLFAAFRSCKMVREISEIYGYRPGLWGRLKIYKKVMLNMIYIGLGDLLMDAASDFVAGTSATVMDKVAGQVNKAFAVGLASGYYTTKIGFMAVRSVRPMDLTKNSRELFNFAQLRFDLCKYVVAKLTFKRGKQQ